MRNFRLRRSLLWESASKEPRGDSWVECYRIGRRRQSWNLGNWQAKSKQRIHSMCIPGDSSRDGLFRRSRQVRAARAKSYKCVAWRRRRALFGSAIRWLHRAATLNSAIERRHRRVPSSSAIEQCHRAVPSSGAIGRRTRRRLPNVTSESDLGRRLHSVGMTVRREVRFRRAGEESRSERVRPRWNLPPAAFLQEERDRHEKDHKHSHRKLLPMSKNEHHGRTPVGRKEEKNRICELLEIQAPSIQAPSIQTPSTQAPSVQAPTDQAPTGRARSGRAHLGVGTPGLSLTGLNGAVRSSSRRANTAQRGTRRDARHAAAPLSERLPSESRPSLFETGGARAGTSRSGPAASEALPSDRSSPVHFLAGSLLRRLGRVNQANWALAVRLPPWEPLRCLDATGGGFRLRPSRKSPPIHLSRAIARFSTFQDSRGRRHQPKLIQA